MANLTLVDNNDYWTYQWINPLDPTDWFDTFPAMHPIGQWVTSGGPAGGNIAELVELVTIPESMKAHLVLTQVNLKDMTVKNYVPRRNFEALSQLMERRRKLEGRADEQAAEASDQATGGEGASGPDQVGEAS